MVELYYKLIKAGKKTIEEIPDKFKIDVQALLEKDNA